ncbi:alkaline phosphatase D family protein [soil metagenome]
MKPASPALKIGRREVLILGAGLVAAPFVLRGGAWADTDLFTLGVASGEPWPDGFVIWCRLVSDPLAADGLGGMTGPVKVTWQVATDAAMRRVVKTGQVTASARLGHSVHVEVAGLQPNRPYYYRFTAAGAQSPVGRTRTAPARGAMVDGLKLVAASCAHWETGYFSAYRHMAAENPDLTLFLGDYIYEYSYTGDRAEGRPRRHDRATECADLAAYRNRYALHHTDPDLKALHQAAPCLAIWDDHEVQNDYANTWSQNGGTSETDFRKRRAAAYQAFYEHLPLRRRSLAAPNGDVRIYDRYQYGGLAEFTTLDSRQYRTIQPCPVGNSRRGHVAPESCPDLADPSRTMLGREQERWLYDGFKTSTARWNIIAQQLLVAAYFQNDNDGHPGHFTDGWDGFQANRDRMLSAVAASNLANPVFLGGDLHAYACTDLKADFRNPASRTLAAEFVGTSVTSDSAPASLLQTLNLNPHVHTLDIAHRGYMSADLTADRMEMRFQAISDRVDPKASVSTLKRYVVEAGKPGAVES